MGIYSKMGAELDSLRMAMSQSTHLGTPEEPLVPLPPKVADYLETRRTALSNAGCRAQDSMGKHLTWAQYHLTMMRRSPVVDSIAWELLYQEFSSIYGKSITALHCIRLGLSSDPARPYVRVGELKPMTEDDKTTPEFVAYANEVSEDLDLDMTQLLPPQLALSLEDMSGANEMMKELFGDEAPDIFDLMLSDNSGYDVTLA